DRTPDRVFARDALGGVRQLVHHLVVQGVELVGAVDGDERDGVADLEQEGFVAHGENGTTKTRKSERGTRNSSGKLGSPVARPARSSSAGWGGSPSCWRPHARRR